MWLSSVELEWATRVPRNSSDAAAEDQVEHLRLFPQENPACLVLKRERAFSECATREQKLRKHQRQSSNRSRRPPRLAGCAFADKSTRLPHGRVGHKRLSDPLGLVASFVPPLPAQIPSGIRRANELMHRPETLWKDNPPTRTSRTEGLAQTCRAILHCRTGHRSCEVDDRGTRAYRALHSSGRASLLVALQEGLPKQRFSLSRV